MLMLQASHATFKRLTRGAWLTLILWRKPSAQHTRRYGVAGIPRYLTSAHEASAASTLHSVVPCPAIVLHYCGRIFENTTSSLRYWKGSQKYGQCWQCCVVHAHLLVHGDDGIYLIRPIE
jgi:hypothetical protein